MNLSVCLIVKNEEKNLPRCLRSVKDLVQEIVVVDTGSTDRTKEIALEYGAKVVDFVWCNDFSAARNLSIDNATGDWILFLDADEEMPRDDLIQLINMIKTEKKAEAYFLRMVNFIKGQDIGSAIVLRAFKNRPEYRFVGKLHEQIINSIEDKAGLEAIIPTQVRIFHYGYDPDIVDSDAKSKRNLEILLAYPEDKKDGYYYYSLGNEYARIDDYEKALEIYFKAIKVTDYVRNRYIYFPYLILNIMKSYSSLKRFNDVIKTLETYKKFLPDFKDMYFLGTLACIECGKHSKGRRYIEKYAISQNASYEYPNNNYDKMYDINSIATQLDGGMINKSNFLIGCAVVVEKAEGNIGSVVKNINELCDEVIVFDLNSGNETVKESLQMGAKIVECKKESLEKLISKHLKTKWILTLREDEILPYGQQSVLADILETEKDKCAFMVEILDIKTNEMRVEERLILRNILKTKIQKNIDDYDVKDIDITIYENYL
ncbi:MAG: glycosyltransferase [Clostridium sp.]|uniref:glycosyltransferase family 2 protein n=1 Tax=Clostridium sp. TaxID=1506 RepID=UPI003F41A5FD